MPTKWRRRGCSALVVTIALLQFFQLSVFRTLHSFFPGNATGFHSTVPNDSDMIFDLGNANATAIISQAIDSSFRTRSPLVRSPDEIGPQKTRDVHMTNVAFLDLFPWEIMAIRALENPALSIHESKQSCKPALKMPHMCCPGGAGRQNSFRRECAGKNLSQYYALREAVVKELPLLNTTNQCDLCRVMDLCRQYNLTFGIYGDSLSRQFVEAFECSLIRRSFSVKKTGVRDRGTFEISSPTWKNERIRMHWFMNYKVPHNYSLVEAPGNHPDVNAVLFNFGLHYSHHATRSGMSPQTFFVLLEKLFAHLKQLFTEKKVKVVFYRETSAQHFDGMGGDFFLARNASQLGHCVPQSEHENGGWRDKYVADAAQLNDFTIFSAGRLPSKSDTNPRLIVLPFFHVTRPFHDLHGWNVYAAHDMDCTHYCSVPYLWWPLWRSWRVALEGSVAFLDPTS